MGGMFKHLAEFITSTLEWPIEVEVLEEVVENIHMRLFLAMLIYFHHLSYVVRKVTYVIKYLALVEAERRGGLKNFHPIQEILEKQAMDLCNSIDEFSKFGFTRICMANYCGCLVDEAMEELIEFKISTWLISTVVILVVCDVAAALDAPFTAVVVPSVWVGWLLVLLLMVHKSVQFLAIGKKRPMKEIHQQFQKSLSSRVHTETIVYRMYQVVNFFGCYCGAKLFFSRSLWVHDPQKMVWSVSVNLLSLLFFNLLVLPGVIYNFCVAMGLPPNFDPENQKTLAEIIEKYPHGIPTEPFEGEIKLETDLLSRKLQEEYHKKNPWVHCEINLMSDRGRRCLSRVCGWEAIYTEKPPEQLEEPILPEVDNESIECAFVGTEGGQRISLIQGRN